MHTRQFLSNLRLPYVGNIWSSRSRGRKITPKLGQIRPISVVELPVVSTMHSSLFATDGVLSALPWRELCQSSHNIGISQKSLLELSNQLQYHWLQTTEEKLVENEKPRSELNRSDGEKAWGQKRSQFVLLKIERDWHSLCTNTRTDTSASLDCHWKESRLFWFDWTVSYELHMFCIQQCCTSDIEPQSRRGIDRARAPRI